MKKFIFILPLALLASLGISINSAYYYQSFMTANYGEWFSVGLSATFMGLEAVLWLFGGKRWYIPILKLSIVVFSVAMTLGSQFYSTSKLESDIAEIVYLELDKSGDLQYYRGKLDELDKRLNILIEQQRLFGSERSRSERESIENQKKYYLEKIDSTEKEKEKDVEKINNPISIYSFYAYRMPEIINGDIGEDFVRICFQLFSSILLAIIAPVSLTLLRSYKPAEKQIDTEIANPQPVEPEIETVPEPVEIKFPEYKPEPKISDSDKLNILKMLLYYYRDESSEEKTNLEIMFPEKAVAEFRRLNKERPTVKVHSLENCREIYDEIFEKNLVGKDKEYIKKEIVK